MLVNIDALEHGATVEFDVCIIGAGAAGITLARQFDGSRASVCLLEGGLLEYDNDSASIYASLRNVGRSYACLPGSRLRYFGGTTNHWGGHCVPFRSINFERGAWCQFSGWPFAANELEPFYQRAETLFGIDGYSTDPQTVAQMLHAELFPFDRKCLQTQISRYNRVRFGKVFRPELEASTNITVILGANVTSIEAAKSGALITSVAVRAFDGRRLTVRAKTFVLAMGGIENPRLLLASNSVHRQGLGNEHDLVGRFYMDHISYHRGIILPPSPYKITPLYTSEVPVGRIAYRAHLVLPEEVVCDAAIPDFRTELRAVQYTVNEGVRSAKALHDSFERREWPDHMMSHVANILRNAGTVISRAMSSTPEPPHAYFLLNTVEQAPNPASRVTILNERDQLDVPIAAVDWRLSSIDRDGIRFAHHCIAKEVGRCGFGRFFYDLPDSETELLAGADGAYHHIGTTRMHDDPRQGVVDRNARVHGVHNLYVAGSSVFPTGGFVNPTFTIVALALRLADHLQANMQRGR